MANPQKVRGKHLGFFTEFPTRKGDKAMMKAGISFVSMDGARRNLESDIKGWNFDAVRKQARRLWADAMSAWYTHDEITKGGVLEMEMTAERK